MSGLVRIIWHWSAGTYTPGDSECEHYHFFIDGGGTVYAGDHPPEDNLSTSDDDYAAHVSQFNTGSIGVAVCAMNGAVESPFDPGEYPIRDIQVEALLAVTAKLCDTYAIPVSRSTVLSHAEVQPTCGVPQSGKWDISWIPGMDTPSDPLLVGDELRQRLLRYTTPSTTEQRLARLEEWARTMGYTV